MTTYKKRAPFKLTETVHIGAVNCNGMTITTEAHDLDDVGRNFVTAMTNAGASSDDGQQAWEQMRETVRERLYEGESPITTFAMGNNLLKVERLVDYRGVYK
jgi:hypothetical protein